jgi:predicted SprT family Zn-dependent metalloprotease
MAVTLSQVLEIGTSYRSEIIKNGFYIPSIYWKLHSGTRINGRCSQRPLLTEISINSDISTEKDLREVIAHELCHAIKIEGNIKHSPTWKKLARTICVDILKLEGGYSTKQNRELDSSKKVVFSVTPSGIEFQKNKKYKDSTKIHTLFISSEKSFKKVLSLEKNGYIEIKNKEELL